MNPAFQDVLGHIRWGMLEKLKASFDKALGIGEEFSSASQDWFKACMAQFDEECAGAIIEQANWDTSKVREKLVRDIEAHISSVRTSKLSELTSLYEVTERLNESLGKLSFVTDFEPLICSQNFMKHYQNQWKLCWKELMMKHGQ